MREGQRGASRGSGSPARCAVEVPPTTAATPPARTAPGAASHAPPGRPPFTRGQALGPRDPGHLFPPKPVVGSTEGLPRPGRGPCGDAIPPRACPVLDTGCGSRIRPALRRSSPSRTPSRHASGILPRRPASPGECPRERWTDSSGARCRPGSGGRQPSEPLRA